MMLWSICSRARQAGLETQPNAAGSLTVITIATAICHIGLAHSRTRCDMIMSRHEIEYPI